MERRVRTNGCFPSLATDRQTESFSTRTSIGLRLAGLSACLSGGPASLDEQWMEIGGRDNETTSEGDREGIRNTITRTNGSGEHYLQMKVRNPHSDLERKLGINENETQYLKTKTPS